jgi:hydroxypyruvate reductase/glycerate 2-kinase
VNARSVNLRRDAERIWYAAVDAVRPQPLLQGALHEPGLARLLAAARRIVVVGAGKASAAMAEGVEHSLPQDHHRLSGLVNVPDESVRPLMAIRLHAARPAGSNHPTAAGVEGADEILRLVEQAGPEDVVLCLISGGGSALLPAPVEGVSLEDKQHVTKLLHACGATINEMNAVRKHLSRIKGGRLAQACRAGQLISLIISDVIGDPLDVIGSGPTAPDPTTFADALAVLDGYNLIPKVAGPVLAHLRAGAAGQVPETPEQLPGNVRNLILANNAMALASAGKKAAELGYRVANLGAFIEGETRQVATVLAGCARSIRHHGQPEAPPVCLLSGGETTVTLAADHGAGGRNQEFVLAALLKLGAEGMREVVVLSGGTDGEDGPTDAAGALADEGTLCRAAALGLDPTCHLAAHDAYSFFQATGDLLKSGLTQTNVMDVRIILLGERVRDS